jgi:hypothetical protein
MSPIWWTNRPKPMAYAVRAFNQAIVDGSLSHDGNERFARHIGHAYRKSISVN